MSNINLGKYLNWPPYPSYGDWERTRYDTTVGSRDHILTKTSFPVSQFSVRYNPFSNEIPLNYFAGILPLPSLPLVSLGYTTVAFLSASYMRWLQSGEKQAAMFQLIGSQSPPRYFGIVPPTFDYQIEDTIKECVHYGIEGSFFCWVDGLGTVWFITVDSFYAYPEYIARCRFKTFRVINGEILSVFKDEDNSSNQIHQYDLTISTDNKLDIDLSNSNVKMKIYNKNSSGEVTGNIDQLKILSINKNIATVKIESDDYSEDEDFINRWNNTYFILDKSIIIEDPLLLYTDRKLNQTGNITNNTYVTEVNGGYETRSQQMENSGNIEGIYINKNNLINYLLGEIEEIDNNEDSDSDDAVRRTRLRNDILIIDPSYDFNDDDADDDADDDNDDDDEDDDDEDEELSGNIESDFSDMFYIDLTIDYASRFVGYISDMPYNKVFFHIGIGGGTTMYHNMHAGCLKNAYIENEETQAIENSDNVGIIATNTFKILKHIRNSIFLIDTNNLSHSNDLLTIIEENLLLDTPVLLPVKVKAKKCWFFNDICYSKSKVTLDESFFWGHITRGSGFDDDTDPAHSEVTIKIDSGYWIYGERENLVNRFTQDTNPTILSNIKKWNKFKNWRLNSSFNDESYEIISIAINSSDPQSFDITLDGKLYEINSNGVVTSDIIADDKKWWISFDEKFDIASGYNYISTPYFAMDGYLSGSTSGAYRSSLLVEGLYVALPYKIGINQEQVLSVVLENSAIYPNLNLPPQVFFSSSRSSWLNFCRNDFLNARVIVYKKHDDKENNLYIRFGNIDFKYTIFETLVFKKNRMKLLESDNISFDSGDINLNLSSIDSDHNISGIEYVQPSDLADKKIIFQSFYNNNPLSYYLNSGKALTQLTKMNDLNSEESEKFNYYVYMRYAGNLHQRQFSYLPIDRSSEFSNTLHLKNVSPDNSRWNPDKIIVHHFPKEDTVKNFSNPFIFSSKYLLNTICYLKEVVIAPNYQYRFLIESEEDDTESANNSESEKNLLLESVLGNNYTVGSFVSTIKKREVIVTVEEENYKKVIDSSQTGVFTNLSNNLFISFSSIHNYYSNTTNYSDTSLTGFHNILLIPNISSCYYDAFNDIIHITGYSDIERVKTLVYYALNIDSLMKKQKYIFNYDTSNSFIYYNTYEERKVIISQSDISGINTAFPFTISNLNENPLSMSFEKGRIVIAMQIAMQFEDGLFFFLSTNYGQNWALLDDIKITILENISQPTVKIINEQLIILFVSSNNLYSKIIPINALFSLYTETKGKKSSAIESEGYITRKEGVQGIIDESSESLIGDVTGCKHFFIQSSREKHTNIVFEEADGTVGSFYTVNMTEWERNPINF